MSRPLSIPVYATGTVAVSSSGAVTGTGTNFLSPDGSGNWSIAVGDIFVCGNCFAPVANNGVISATSLQLAGWSAGTIAAGSSFYILRYSGLPNTAVVGLIQQLISLVGSASGSAPQDFVAGTNFTPGVTTTLTLSDAPLAATAVSVYINGVRQPQNAFSVSGSTVTFTSPLPADAQVVTVTQNN